MMELTNKQLDAKYETACNDLRNLIQELSLKVEHIRTRVERIEKKIFDTT